MMRTKFLQVIYAIFVLLNFSCASTRRTLSTQRGIDGLTKPGIPYAKGRAMMPQNSDLYTESKQIQIQAKDQRNTTGSLYNLDDRRNILALDQLSVSVGDDLGFKIIPVGGTSEAQSAPTSANSNAAAANPNAATPPADSGDAFVKEMLERLPQLDPGENKPPLLKSLRMRVAHVFDNGDVLVSYTRSSIIDDEDRKIAITGRVPASRLKDLASLSTNDLFQVNWRDNLEGQLADRSAETWQDEYSLRLSGYSEARSLLARQLDEKRRQLLDMRKQLNNQLIGLGKERQRFAEERATMNKERGENQQKMQELNQELEDAKGKIADYEEEQKAKEEDAAKNDSGEPPSLSNPADKKGTGAKDTAKKAGKPNAKK